MLSRVANNLFWMDRYMERSYGLLNLIKTNYNSTLDNTLFNKATKGIYELGSTLKLITAAIAFESKLINENLQKFTVSMEGEFLPDTNEYQSELLEKARQERGKKFRNSTK